MTLTWIDKILDGMKAFFIADADVSGLIASRFYEVAAEQWILTLETLQSEKSPRLGRWASYQVVGSPSFQNLSGQSTFRRLIVSVSCYAGLPKDCRQAFTAFYNALATGAHAKTGENRHYGTWGTGDDAVAVEAVRFDTESLLHDYDDTFRQAVVSCNLLVTVPSG